MFPTIFKQNLLLYNMYNVYVLILTMKIDNLFRSFFFSSLTVFLLKKIIDTFLYDLYKHIRYKRIA